MNRITSTDKWKDSWFLQLSPNGKLMFMYLCDNCDEAGFYALNSTFMAKQLNMPAKQVVASVKEISEKLVFDGSGKKVWVKNFLFYQKRLPLDLTNDDHKKILLMLEKNFKAFGENDDMAFITHHVETGKKKRATTSPRKKFEKPTFEEFEAYGKEYAEQKGFNINAKWYSQLYEYYESNGWKVGKNAMADWKAAIRKNISKEDKPKVVSKEGGGNGKIDKIRRANEAIQDVQVEN